MKYVIPALLILFYCIGQVAGRSEFTEGLSVVEWDKTSSTFGPYVGKCLDTDGRTFCAVVMDGHPEGIVGVKR